MSPANRTHRTHAVCCPYLPGLMVLTLAAILCLPLAASAQIRRPPEVLTIARLKYPGGSDWYNGPTEIPNLLAFIRAETTVRTADQEARIEIMDEDLFAYPVLYLTGHGNIKLSDEEVPRLRTYLERGGFLFANDDYGLDKAFRRELARVFPDKRLVELPRDHGVFRM